jgi:hypothetical protein
MNGFVFDPALSDPATALNTVMTSEGRVAGKRRFRKGHRIAEADLADLIRVEHRLHLVRLDDDDVHEDDAGIALAASIAGPGIEHKRPIQSRVNLMAASKGLLRIDHDAIVALNRLPGISVFSLLDRIAVVPGKNVAGAKIAPVAVPRSVLDAALEIAGPGPVVQIKPFAPKRVAVISTEGLDEGVQERFRTAVIKKVGWYGSEVTGFTELPDDADLVAEAMTNQIAEGADLILTGGGNSLDPLDPTLVALGDIGAQMIKFGAPAHPGSMFWLAQRGSVPIFNLASCSLYSRSTVADIVLPWIMAGESVELDDIAEIGFGGLLDRDMSFRFPPYDSDEVRDEG